MGTGILYFRYNKTDTITTKMIAMMHEIEIMAMSCPLPSTDSGVDWIGGGGCGEGEGGERGMGNALGGSGRWSTMTIKFVWNPG